MNELSLAGPLAGFGCTLIIFAAAFVMLDRKGYYARWVPVSFIAAGMLVIVSGAFVEVWNATQADAAAPAPQAEYTYPAIAPPLSTLMSYPCMDGSMPWNDNGRASCLTREQSEARAAHRAKALKAWNEQRGDIEEIICGSTLTFDICIEIKSGKTVDPNADL